MRYPLTKQSGMELLSFLSFLLPSAPQSLCKPPLVNDLLSSPDSQQALRRELEISFSWCMPHHWVQELRQIYLYQGFLDFL